jgi:toxin-antitoxin system PIN domain toxin
MEPMQLVDVNVLVYAFRKDVPQHAKYAAWMRNLVGGDRPFGVPDLVLSGFLRIVTHPRVFSAPTPTEEALAFAERLRESPMFAAIAPGPRHWSIFAGLCRTTGARGNLVPDAYLAALAIESGSEWITTDRDYSRFPGLQWQTPLLLGDETV